MTNGKPRNSSPQTPDVLKGPPGLLFGLTLLVFLCARLYFTWVPEVSESAPTPHEVKKNHP